MSALSPCAWRRLLVCLAFLAVLSGGTSVRAQPAESFAGLLAAIEARMDELDKSVPEQKRELKAWKRVRRVARKKAPHLEREFNLALKLGKLRRKLFLRPVVEKRTSKEPIAEPASVTATWDATNASIVDRQRAEFDNDLGPRIEELPDGPRKDKLDAQLVQGYFALDVAVIYLLEAQLSTSDDPVPMRSYSLTQRVDSYEQTLRNAAPGLTCGDPLGAQMTIFSKELGLNLVLQFGGGHVQQNLVLDLEDRTVSAAENADGSGVRVDLIWLGNLRRKGRTAVQQFDARLATPGRSFILAMPVDTIDFDQFRACKDLDYLSFRNQVEIREQLQAGGFGPSLTLDLDVSAVLQNRRNF